VAKTLLDDLKHDIAVAAWTGLLESGVDECVKVAHPLPKGWEERVRAEIASGDLDEMLSVAEKISRRLGAPDGGANEGG
jgi:hypothetical protein